MRGKKMIVIVLLVIFNDADVWK